VQIQRPSNYFVIKLFGITNIYTLILYNILHVEWSVSIVELYFFRFLNLKSIMNHRIFNVFTIKLYIQKIVRYEKYVYILHSKSEGLWKPRTLENIEFKTRYRDELNHKKKSLMPLLSNISVIDFRILASWRLYNSKLFTI